MYWKGMTEGSHLSGFRVMASALSRDPGTRPSASGMWRREIWFQDHLKAMPIGSTPSCFHLMADVWSQARMIGLSAFGTQRWEMWSLDHLKDTLALLSLSPSRMMASALSLAHWTCQFLSGIQRRERSFLGRSGTLVGSTLSHSRTMIGLLSLD